MADASTFISWYRIQYFPIFSEDLLKCTSGSLTRGFDEAKASVLARPGAEGDRDSLAMLSILEKMKKQCLDVDTACHIVRMLNTIAQPD